jgi:ABC-type sulfate transport system permease component
VGTSLESAGLSSALSDPMALDYLGKVVYAQALTMAYQDSFMILAIVFVLALPLAWVLGRVKRQAPVAAPAE